MLYRVPLIENALIAGASSAEYEQVWPLDGVLIAVALGTTSGLLVDRAGLELAAYRRRRELVHDDFGRQFLPGCILGAADPAIVDWMPLFLPVKAGEIWTLQLRNAGPNTVTPQLLFDYVRQGDESRVRPAA
jgi:hypothetical protein